MACWMISLYDNGTALEYVNTSNGKRHSCGKAKTDLQGAVDWVVKHGLTMPGDTISVPAYSVVLMIGDERTLRQVYPRPDSSGTN